MLLAKVVREKSITLPFEIDKPTVLAYEVSVAYVSTKLVINLKHITHRTSEGNSLCSI